MRGPRSVRRSDVQRFPGFSEEPSTKTILDLEFFRFCTPTHISQKMLVSAGLERDDAKSLARSLMRDIEGADIGHVVALALDLVGAADFERGKSVATHSVLKAY